MAQQQNNPDRQSGGGDRDRDRKWKEWVRSELDRLSRQQHQMSLIVDALEDIATAIRQSKGDMTLEQEQQHAKEEKAKDKAVSAGLEDLSKAAEAADQPKS